MWKGISYFKWFECIALYNQLSLNCRRCKSFTFLKLIERIIFLEWTQHIYRLKRFQQTRVNDRKQYNDDTIDVPKIC